MKKSLIIGSTLSLSLLFLAACGNKEETTTPEETLTGTEQQAILPTENEITMTCPEAIQAYLNQANLEGEGDITVKTDDAIVVDYIGRLANGTVFDTSVESVAKACGIYNANRDYNEGLSFTVGTQGIIQGFNSGALGMKLNQTKTVTVPATQAYGERIEEYVQTYPTADFGNLEGFVEGQRIYAPDGSSALISKITDKEITLDLNHELAGKDLIFDITIKSIN
ncbi:MAG: FKBP-type peptidyl-prolyl cis-trans isomerase [Candidatus Peribacteria bacterium]|jgi:FKBP-type peptidyl-prolyl cis-trans isomerase 2|nr:FKBP-type peptidyl-prolyl cis-trans isomerase [Candidatus Peribacteria bacterium]